MEAPWSFGPSAVAAFIVFIGVLIFVHELGHFLAAKYFNIKVLKFSLGFGPSLLSFTRGETTYQIAAIPLGGYVKMVGDVPGEDVHPDDRGRSFTSAPIYQRAVVALAGPAFNLVFPILCFFAYNVLGPQVIAPIVGQIEIGQPADRAGLKPGDRIVAVDGHRTWSFRRITELISARPGRQVPLEVERDGQQLNLVVTPDAIRDENLFGSPEERGIIAVSTTREGTRVGVVDPQKALGFTTGDQVLSVDGHGVTTSDQLVRAIKQAAGKKVAIVVSRPEPKVAGDLLYASAGQPLTLELEIPADATGLAELGLASSEMFLRKLVPGGAADRAGLRPGDQILAVNGRAIRLFWSYLLEQKNAADKPLKLTVARDGQTQEVELVAEAKTCVHDVTKKPTTLYDPGLGLGDLGPEASCSTLQERQQTLAHWSSVVAPETEEARLTLPEALWASVRQTGEVIGFVGTGLFKLFSAEISVDNVGGPIQLFKLAAQAAEVGVFAYLRMLALISVNLGLINLLPIPIFDGGHLVFCLVEAIKRQPVSLRAREAASIIGIAILVALLVLALRNDILSLGIF